MKLGEIKKLVEGTADAAFSISPDGLITSWNQAAVELFGVIQNDALGKTCGEVMRGVDECGKSCSESCSVLQKAKKHQPVKSYDIQVNTNGKPQWLNVSVLIVDEEKSTMPYTVHIARPADMQKRFELLMRDFVVRETNLPINNLNEIMSVKQTPTNNVELSKRELEILRCLASGTTTSKIAEELFISRTTVNNHIQNIMKKLDAHSRLEAVRRAEQARLI